MTLITTRTTSSRMSICIYFFLLFKNTQGVYASLTITPLTMFCDTTFERGEGGTKLNNIQDRVTDYTHEHNDHASIVFWKDERRVEPGLLNDDVDAKDEADVGQYYT